MEIREKAQKWARSKKTGNKRSLERGFFWGYLQCLEDIQKEVAKEEAKKVSRRVVDKE